jgi:hypothetical protein
MRLTLSIPDSIANEITQVAKATGYTKSGLVLTALNIYFLLYHSDRYNAKQLAITIPENQTSIYDFIQSNAKPPGNSG